MRDGQRGVYVDVTWLFDADYVLIPLADLDENICAAIASIELAPDRTPADR